MTNLKTRLASLALAAGLIAGSASGALAQTATANNNMSPDTPTASDTSQAPNNPGVGIHDRTGQAMYQSPAQPMTQTDNQANQTNTNGNTTTAGTTNNTYQNNAQQNGTTVAAQARPGITADNAGQNLSDRDIMQKIRKSVVADGTLSTSAHNVKIIAKNGRVVLKGPVKSDAEKQAVVMKASNVVGNNKVIDRLSIANP